MNYSPAAEQLLRSGEIDVDVFKCPPWPDLIAAAERWRPVMVHFDFQAGQGPPTPAELDTAADWRRRTTSPWVNTHLAPRVGSTEIRHQTRRDIEALGHRFGHHNVMVENVPWERRADFPLDRAAADPRLLSEVIEATGSRLLLDLAHSRLTAEELEIPATEHLTAHPTDQLAELHVTGLGNDPAGRRRDHMPMDTEAWRLLDLALEAIATGRWRRPWAIALEYGGVGPLFEWRSDPRVLGRDLRRLADRLDHHGLRHGDHSPMSESNS